MITDLSSFSPDIWDDLRKKLEEMDNEEWMELLKDAELPPTSDVDTVILKITEINTCRMESDFVEFYLDEDGYTTVTV